MKVLPPQASRPPSRPHTPRHYVCRTVAFLLQGGGGRGAGEQAGEAWKPVPRSATIGMVRVWVYRAIWQGANMSLQAWPVGTRSACLGNDFISGSEEPQRICVAPPGPQRGSSLHHPGRGSDILRGMEPRGDA